MNKFLLLAAAVGVSLTAMAESPVKVAGKVSPSKVAAPAKYVKTSNNRVMVVTTPDGLNVGKTLATPLTFNKKITPAPALRTDGDVLDGGNVLFESFEGWDGTTTNWVPDGWTIESKNAPQESYINSWFPSAGGAYYPPVSDGKYYFGVIFGTDQDEWLISPEVTLPEQPMSLFYDLTVDPMWYYSMDNINWDTMEYEGEKIVVFDIKVLISVDGGEWAVLKDYAEEYKSYSFAELMGLSKDELSSQAINLQDYVGKKVKVAFEYVGSDGNSVFLDKIRIGLPEIDSPVYSMPDYVQYWGTNRELSTTQFSSAFFPVFTPITWRIENQLDMPVNYTWQYHAPGTNGDDLSTATGEELTVTYTPDYTSEFTTRNNLYFPPIVTATAEGSAPGSYKNPATYMQMGGEPYFKFSDGTDIKMGVLPVNISNDGITFTTYEQEEFGVPATPIFGYDSNTDKYWTDYTFHGEEDPGEYSKLLGVLNLIPAPASPMVVNGVHLDAIGHGIGADVTFTCRIFPTAEDGSVMPDAPLATATLKGSDIVLLSEGSVNNYYTLPFDFEQPAVLDDSHGSYLVEVYGFNDPAVEYFAPLQSALPMEPVRFVGWLRREIFFAGQTRESYSSMAYQEGDYGPCYNAFLLNLEACYPWLRCEKETVEVTEGTTEIALDSFYDGEALTITAPEWATVTASGRYGTTALSVVVENSETDREGDLVVEAPGVKATIHLTQKGVSGISEITAGDDSAVTAVYNLNGQKVNPAALNAGIYLVKRASGKVEKMVVK